MTIILVGKTASGKTAIKKALTKNYPVAPLVTCTTRPPRKGEVHGKDYFFLSYEEFREALYHDQLAEATAYNVSGEPWYYGSYLSYYKEHHPAIDAVIVLNPAGLKQIKENHPNLDVVSFYIECPEEVIKKRHENRDNTNAENFNTRLQNDNIDFKGIEYLVDYKIVNNGTHSPERLAKAIWETVKQHKERRK